MKARPKTVLKVERSGEVGATKSVDYATTNATAMGQPDYLPTAEWIAFAPGETNNYDVL